LVPRHLWTGRLRFSRLFGGIRLEAIRGIILRGDHIERHRLFELDGGGEGPQGELLSLDDALPLGRGGLGHLGPSKGIGQSRLEGLLVGWAI
jgi:hypothetical protein